MARRLLLILTLFLVGDMYFYQVVTTLTQNPTIHLGYWLTDVLLIAGMTGVILLLRAGKNVQPYVAGLMTAILLLFVPKLFTTPILMAEDILRLFRGFPPRSVYVAEAALALAGLLFVAILFGITRGKHFYRVKRETLYFPDLPEAFDGFTITQISDVHSGSFSDSKGVQKGLDLAASQNSDLLLFTGDLVNNMASEMDPWISSFAKLKAPYGKYSVLGNHDYGDYMRWESKDAKAANLDRLKEVHEEIGFNLLLNDAVTIKKHGESISLIGVENWGKGGFHKYGDLIKATADVPGNAFKILMSHDPSHWDEVTVGHHQHVHLTLAGHTHGMQFGIELFGLKWSPIKYFYKQWAGLYSRGGKYLYVNRGFGFHGLKGRIGMWPEITVLTLKRSETARRA
jgi:uncharacterized protein